MCSCGYEMDLIKEDEKRIELNNENKNERKNL